MQRRSQIELRAAGTVLEASKTPLEPTKVDAIRLVRDAIGPVAAFKMAIVVGRVPKTRSGKILRGGIKKFADQDAWTTPPTIEDPKALDEIAAALDARAR